MDLFRRIILALLITGMVTVTVVPCFAATENEDDIWTKERPREPRRGPGREQMGRGPVGRDLMRRGRRFEPTEEEINSIIEGIKKQDPQRAKKLTELRKKDPEKFKAEIGRLVFERRMEFFRNRWRQEFLAWFEKVKPREAEALAALKDKDAELYTQKYDHARRKYWRIFEEGRRFPELEEVLLADLQLQERQDVLLRKIRAAKSEAEKKEPMAQLQEVVAAKYDLLIRRKQIAYERLLKRLEEIQEEINKSREEITKWKDEEVKKQNVEVRVKELVERPPRLRWD